MNRYDPLVANGIIYAPIDDIIKSSGPVHGVGPYSPYRPNANYIKDGNDSFLSSNKTKSTFWKWALGITGAVAAVIGLKKGVNFVRNSAKCQEFFTKNPKIKSVLSKIKSYIPFVKKW